MTSAISAHNVVIIAPSATAAALKPARRADTEERQHPETEIDRAGMNKQSFEHVLASAHAGSSEPTGLV